MTPAIRRLPLLFLFLGAAASRSRGSDAGVAAELAKADALRDAHEAEAAKAVYAKILRIAPDNPEANCSYGLYAADEGDWRRALKCEAKAVAADPGNARYQYGWGVANGKAALKGVVFAKMAHARKCLAAFQRASELAPDNLQYRWSLMLYYEQAPAILGGNMDLAYAEATAIKKLNVVSGREAFAQVYTRDRKYDLAFQEYEQLLQAAPDSYSDLYDLGQLTLSAGRHLEQGLAALRRCLALPPVRGGPTHAEVHWRIGGILERQGRSDLARAEYLEALKEEPQLQPARQALDRLGKA
ncbi:MAG TPA: tetratricopeptide repeat protein [Opitutaceae bacterium]|nr:tetratricopeptide repeat protein [Opitutaceae bacterium]